MAPSKLAIAVGLILALSVVFYSTIFFISRPMTSHTHEMVKPRNPAIDISDESIAHGIRFLPTKTNDEVDARFSSVVKQLQDVEKTLPVDVVNNFQFQSDMPRQDRTRPHHMSFRKSLEAFPVPVPEYCPSSIRPDEFCAPNLGRDWSHTSTVFPISYSLPAELFPARGSLPVKDQDCSSIVPRDRSTYNFASEEAYIAEYARSFYCISYKKGGWDVLRHYEIIAAGCMPYLPDIESCPVYTLYHLPKQLLLEARDLPGVYFNCSTVRVVIDHTLFPRERYLALLSQLLEHSRNFLTTKAMAQYVLNASGMPHAKKILYFAAAKKGVMLKAQGNYNSWTLFHGLRTLLGPSVVDPFPIPFLYNQPKSDALASEKRQLYGYGFGYAYKLPNIAVDRENIVARIKRHEFDLIIFGDPTSMSSTSSRSRATALKYLSLVKSASYKRNEILFLHAPDIAYPAPSTVGYDVQALYEEGLVFQREIMDCAFYAPNIPRDLLFGAGGKIALTRSEAMKRCVWYHNKNCLDDVNVLLTMQRKGLSQYPWNWPTFKRNGSNLS